MISRFYFSGVLPRQGDVELPAALAHHALNVLRLAPGERLVLFDGSGGEFEARLDVRGHAAFAGDGRWREASRESPLDVVLVQALASGDKMDWAIQKAVELGVGGVIPLQAARSVAKLGGERALKRHAHWRRVVIAACEQCGRNRLPFVAPLAALSAYLDEHRHARRLILTPDGAPLSTLAPEARPIHLLVGPEGGWSDAELAAALHAGCQPIGLGPRILRTETAGLAALAALQAREGDF
jgi:16S rRNA (uracil1498-N3)-methyltransferase